MADQNKPSSVTIYISVILFVCFGYGIYDCLTGFEENGCEMTYMYEYPQFVRVSLPQNITENYPRYKLYVYGEGSYTEQLRDGKYNGIPVLFIPGNGGSYKQARSLASVAYRRAVDSRSRHHFNVFTVDLGEDLAAVNGRLLTEQTRFVAACLRAVLRLYRRRPAGQAPTSVAVVGHSMGGVVARGLFALPGFDPASVSLLYLLAAPIAEPPLRVDLAMVQYYSWVETFWSARRNTTLSGVSVVSISGGDRDVQVRPHLTAHSSSDITAVTTSVPGVWVSADHQCIVWCRQLVLVLARSLFDLVNPDSKQLTADPAIVRRVLTYYFVQQTHGKHSRNAFHPATIPMDQSGEWKQYALRQWTYTADEPGRPTYLMVGLMNNPLYQRATLRAVNLPSRDWLVACVASKMHKAVRMCEEGDNLSSLAQQVPSQKAGRRRSATLDLQQLLERGYTHVVVIVRPSSEQVTVECDVSRHSDRQVAAEVPAFTSFRAFFNQQVLLAETQAGALSYNVSLKGLTDPWQAVRVSLRPTAACGLSSRAGLSFNVPWAQQTRHVISSGGTESSVAAKLQFPRPANLSGDVLPYVTADLDPSCRYSISLQNSFPELWGQMARYFGALLLPAALSVVLVTLAEQLRAADAGQTLTAHAAMLQLTPLKLVMPSQLLTSLLGWSVLAARLPAADLPRLAGRGLTCSTLPFLLYFVSWAMIALLALTGWAAVVLIGGLVHKVAGRLVSRAVDGSEAVAEVAVAGAARFPVILSVGLSALALSSCGEVALGLGLLVCCVKVFQSYEEVLGGGGRPAALKAYTSLTLTLVWLWVTLFHLPCLVVWSKTRSESSQLVRDPSLVVALIMVNSGAVLWRDAALRLDLVGYRPLAAAVNTAAIAVYLFGLVNVYRASWLAAAAVLAVALHQLVAPSRDVPPEHQEEEQEQEQKADGAVERDQAALSSGPVQADDDAPAAAAAAAVDDGDGDDVDSLDGGEEGDDRARRRAGRPAGR